MNARLCSWFCCYNGACTNIFIQSQWIALTKAEIAQWWEQAQVLCKPNIGYDCSGDAVSVALRKAWLAEDLLRQMYGRWTWHSSLVTKSETTVKEDLCRIYLSRQRRACPAPRPHPAHRDGCGLPPPRTRDMSLMAVFPVFCVEAYKCQISFWIIIYVRRLHFGINGSGILSMQAQISHWSELQWLYCCCWLEKGCAQQIESCSTNRSNGVWSLGVNLMRIVLPVPANYNDSSEWPKACLIHVSMKKRDIRVLLIAPARPIRNRPRSIDSIGLGSWTVD